MRSNTNIGALQFKKTQLKNKPSPWTLEPDVKSILNSNVTLPVQVSERLSGTV